MKLSGDQLGPEHVVIVNNKMVQGNIKELDTEEGWVDVFMPIIPTETNELSADDVIAGEADLALCSSASLFRQTGRHCSGFCADSSGGGGFRPDEGGALVPA